MDYGPFQHQYPYSNFHDLNLDWVLQQLNEMDRRIDNIIADAVDQANAYTDQQLAKFKQDFADLTAQVYTAMDELREQQTAFIQSVTESINAINAKVDKLENDLNAGIQSMQVYTDLAIEANNEYILQQIESQLIGIKVINYFTGQKVTVQEMFDILAQYHLEDAMTYSQYADKEVTYTQLAALSITYSQLINNGNNLVHQ